MVCHGMRVQGDKKASGWVQPLQAHLEHALIAGLPHNPGLHQLLAKAKLRLAALLVPGRLGACSPAQHGLALLQMEEQASAGTTHAVNHATAAVGSGWIGHHNSRLSAFQNKRQQISYPESI